MLFKSFFKALLLVITMTLTLFTGLVYADSITSPDAITIASEPVPFVDQGLTFISLKDLSNGLSGQLTMDLGEFTTSNKKIYTF